MWAFHIQTELYEIFEVLIHNKNMKNAKAMYTFGTYRKMRLQKKLSNRSPRVEITVVTVEQQLNPKLKNQRSTKFFGNYSQLR